MQNLLYYVKCGIIKVQYFLNFNSKGDITMSNYTETFVSPFEKETKGEALRVLQSIRDVHSVEYGWVELEGFVEQLPNGKWRAVRVHEQRK